MMLYFFSRRVKYSRAPIRYLTSQNKFWNKAEHVERLLHAAMRKENYDRLKDKCKEWNNYSGGDVTWNGTNSGQDIAMFKSAIDYFDQLQGEFGSIIDLYKLGEAEGENDILDICLSDLMSIEENIRERNKSRIMSSSEDNSSCYAEIVAGVGGLDAYDWTNMLACMYAHWATTVMGYKVQYVDENMADQSTHSDVLYRRVTLRFDGHKAYGYFKAEAGVHRLVRRSPFDPSDKRHTSFAQVQVYPVPPDEDNTPGQPPSFHVDANDIRVETFRSRGAGGQSVNTTDSAVRLTHIPTGTVTSCQNERSQHTNKASAMKVLKAKLWQLELRRRAEEKKKLTIGVGSNSWGAQIRSVVLHPYQMVKDHRSNWETSDVDTYLRGSDLLTEVALTTLQHFDDMETT